MARSSAAGRWHGHEHIRVLLPVVLLLSPAPNPIAIAISGLHCPTVHLFALNVDGPPRKKEKTEWPTEISWQVKTKKELMEK